MLLGMTFKSHCLTCTGLSPSTAGLSSPLRLQQWFLTLCWYGSTNPMVPQPRIAQRLPAITPTRFSLFRFRSPLLTESLLFSLPVGTEMFHFPTFPPNALCVQAPVTGHDSSWVSPFGHPRITARLSTSRGLSQAPTSFIGSWCQGIHHVPLVACHFSKQNCYKDARVHYAVLKVRAVPNPRSSRARARDRQVVRGWIRPRGDAHTRDPSGPNSVPGPRSLSALDVPRPPASRLQY